MLSAKIWVSVLVVFKKSLESTTNINKIQDSRFFFRIHVSPRAGSPISGLRRLLVHPHSARSLPVAQKR